MAVIKTTDNNREDMERLKPSYTAGGNADGSATVEDTLAVP